MNLNQLLRNWKPTVSSLVAVVAGFIAMFPEDFAKFPSLVHAAKFIGLGGIAALGLTSKSADVTGAGDKAKTVQEKV